MDVNDDWGRSGRHKGSGKRGLYGPLMLVESSRSSVFLQDIRLNSPDYKEMSKEKADADFTQKVDHYHDQYEPISNRQAFCAWQCRVQETDWLRRSGRDFCRRQSEREREKYFAFGFQTRVARTRKND